MLADGRKIAKFFCCDCGKYWTAAHNRNTCGKDSEIVKESLERASLRILARRYEMSKTQIMRKLHRVTANAKDSKWLAQNFSLKWSGTLIFDGKVIRAYDKLSKGLKGKISDQELSWRNKKVWLCGIDYVTGDLPHYELSEEESKIDIIMYFRALKEIGYPLRVLVCDGNPDICSAARHVFGDKLIIQLCTRHFVEGLKRIAGEEKYALSTQKIINLIQRIIESSGLEEAYAHLEELNQIKRKTALEKELINLFKIHSPKLTAHLLNPDKLIPHTSNDIENLFKQLNLRLKSIGRFNHWHYARNYLNAWALLRRFTPFTDCRNGRKWRNGKAPLEIAGANIKNIDFLSM